LRKCIVIILNNLNEISGLSYVAMLNITSLNGHAYVIVNQK